MNLDWTIGKAMKKFQDMLNISQTENEKLFETIEQLFEKKTKNDWRKMKRKFEDDQKN